MPLKLILKQGTFKKKQQKNKKQTTCVLCCKPKALTTTLAYQCSASVLFKGTAWTLGRGI